MRVWCPYWEQRDGMGQVHTANNKCQQLHKWKRSCTYFFFLCAWKSWMARGIDRLTHTGQRRYPPCTHTHNTHTYTHTHPQTHIIAYSISTRLFFCCKLQLRVPTSAHLCNKNDPHPFVFCYCFFSFMQCNVGQAHPFVSLGSYVCSLINNQIQDYRHPLFLP